MSEFKIGDRVVLSDSRYHNTTYSENEQLIEGTKGTVIETNWGPHTLGVQWDIYISGHDCGGKCKYGYGWRVNEKSIKFAPVTDWKQRLEKR